MEKKLVKLKNGITFISQKLDNVHSVTISVNFKVGSSYEDQINNGITHLIEHLFLGNGIICLRNNCIMKCSAWEQKLQQKHFTIMLAFQSP